MPLGPLNFDDLSDSAYAEELKLGVGRLRFQDAIERQYLASHLQHVRLRVRAWFSLWLGLAILFSVVQHARAGVGSPLFWLSTFSTSGAVAMTWVAWSRHYERWFMPVARTLVPIRGVLIAILIARGAMAGHADELMLMTVVLIGVFFFSGLMFRAALLSALAMIVTFSLTVVTIGFLSPTMIRSLVILAMTALIASIVHRDVEMSSRKGFLEDALLAELSMRDGLTGLMNRRALDEHLLRLWQQGQRDHRMLAVLMIDIDHFKAFNDRYGHQAGDVALRRVAQVLKGFARRPLDMAARYGGEEFAVILYDLPQLQHVEDIAERIRRAVQDAALPLLVEDPGPRPSVTVSIGVGTLEPSIGRTPQGALQFADEALYQAKRQGRNRVVFNDPSGYPGFKTGSFRTFGVASG